MQRRHNRSFRFRLQEPTVLSAHLQVRSHEFLPQPVRTLLPHHKTDHRQTTPDSRSEQPDILHIRHPCVNQNNHNGCTGHTAAFCRKDTQNMGASGIHRFFFPADSHPRHLQRQRSVRKTHVPELSGNDKFR